MASRTFYFPHLATGGTPVKPKFNSIYVLDEEPDVPYTVIKVTELRLEDRYVSARTDPASRRRQKVKAIRDACSSLWKALKS